MTEPYYTDDTVTLHHGDALAVLRTMPAESIHCVVTSPPYYGLRDYGEPGQYGLEPTPDAYVETMRAVFAQVRRVLAKDGTLWLNLGDSYVHGRSGPRDHNGGLRGRPNAVTTPEGFGAKPGVAKNLLGIPWQVAFAIQGDGWILRNACVWDKPNAMPESVTDRLSTTYELVFLFVRSQRYWFDLDAIKVTATGKPNSNRSEANAQRAIHTSRRAGGNPGSTLTTGHTFEERNPGDVWTVPTSPFPASHFAVMAPHVAQRCVIAGCKPGGTVLDPFCGSGTTGMVALKNGRRFVGIDLSATYLDLALRTRLAQGALIEDEATW